MKVLVIGAGGTIGSAVVNLLRAENHEVFHASRTGAIPLDIEDKDSISSALARVSPVDAIVVAAGSGPFGPLDELTVEDFYTAIKGKLMGQVNVVRLARQALRTNGSITLTSGILSHSPWPGSAPVAMVNGALESFVRAAAVDRRGQHRINVVSPPLIAETARKRGMKEKGVPVADVAKLYLQAISGEMTGQILSITLT